jgi:hypothetical protein
VFDGHYYYTEHQVWGVSFLVFELFYDKSTKTKSYLGRSFAVTISYLGVEVKKVVVVWIEYNRPDNLPERFFCNRIF